MPGIQQAKQLVPRGVVHVKFMRADGVAFDPNAEHLRFHGDFYLRTVIIQRQDLIERSF